MSSSKCNRPRCILQSAIELSIIRFADKRMKRLVDKELVNIVIINPRKYETKCDETIKLRVKYQTQIKPVSPKINLINNLNGHFFEHQACNQNCCTSSSRNTVVPSLQFRKLSLGMTNTNSDSCLHKKFANLPYKINKYLTFLLPSQIK
jgi:hypothetical protein